MRIHIQPRDYSFTDSQDFVIPFDEPWIREGLQNVYDSAVFTNAFIIKAREDIKKEAINAVLTALDKFFGTYDEEVDWHL